MRNTHWVQDLLGQVSGAGAGGRFLYHPVPDVISNARNLGAGVTAFHRPAADSPLHFGFRCRDLHDPSGERRPSVDGTSLASLQTTVNGRRNSLILPESDHGQYQRDGWTFSPASPGSDYRSLSSASGTYTVTRLSDNTAVAAGVGVGSVVVDGLSIAIGAVGPAATISSSSPRDAMPATSTSTPRFTTDPRQWRCGSGSNPGHADQYRKHGPRPRFSQYRL